jgi:hypothetical protein
MRRGQKIIGGDRRAQEIPPISLQIPKVSQSGGGRGGRMVRGIAVVIKNDTPGRLHSSEKEKKQED